MTVWDQVPAKVDEVEKSVKDLEAKVEKMVAEVKQTFEAYKVEMSAWKATMHTAKEDAANGVDRAMKKLEDHEERLKLLLRAVRKED